MEQYWLRTGLGRDPFIRSSKNTCLYESTIYKEAVARLNLMLTVRGIGEISGPSGTGKTTILRTWCSGLSSSRYKICYLSLSTLSISDFYRELSTQLNLEPKFRKLDNFRQIQAEIRRLCDEQRIVPVIVIDEAHLISGPILQDLKMIFNFDMDSQSKAIVLLAGLPQLRTTLSQRSHESLRQRITMNIAVEGLSQDELQEYIRRKVESVKGPEDLFDAKALRIIAAGANGCMRLADKICSRSLMICDLEQTSRITADIAQKAIEDTQL